MMNRHFWYGPLVISIALMTLNATTESHASELAVSASGRHLTVKDKPFFWLGDTVWLLAQVPSREELELYLRTRAAQGFTVTQLTAVMGEERVWGTARRTTRGDAPFVENDVIKPTVTPGNDPADPTQYDYWDHLDYVLERIHAHGFRVALVTYFVGWQGEGYKFLKPANAQACWSWFAGGYHTYGNGNVWHFDTCKPELTQTWKEALRSPGAATLRQCKGFLAKIGWWKFVPDASAFAEGEGRGRTRNVAMRSLEGDGLAVYFPSPATIKLRLDKIAVGDTLVARWANPATGEERSAGTFDRPARSFTPPAGWGDALLHVAAQKHTPK